MANRSRQRPLYDALVDAFRRAPGNFKGAATLAGCDRRCAKNAWLKGWPDKGDWAPPISQTIEAELEDQRAKARRERTSQNNTRDDAAREMADARRQEGVLIRQTRANAILGANAVAQLLRGLVPAAQKAGELIEADLKAGNPMKPEVVLGHLGKLAYAAQKISDIMETVIRSERTVLGPNAGATTDNPGVIVDSEEEAHEILGAAARARDRIDRKKRGDNPPRLTVVSTPKAAAT